MKKVFYLLFAAGMFSFVSCDSPQENQAEEVQENREDAAEDAADSMEDAADDMEDTTAVVH